MTSPSSSRYAFPCPPKHAANSGARGQKSGRKRRTSLARPFRHQTLRRALVFSSLLSLLVVALLAAPGSRARDKAEVSGGTTANTFAVPNISVRDAQCGRAGCGLDQHGLHRHPLRALRADRLGQLHDGRRHGRRRPRDRRHRLHADQRHRHLHAAATGVKTISVPVLFDGVAGETDETFLVNLSSATNGHDRPTGRPWAPSRRATTPGTVLI